MRWITNTALLAALCLGVLPGAALAKPLQVRCEPLPEVKVGERLGALEYAGGCVLTGSSRWFGGLSSLQGGADGAHLLAVSDRGFLAVLAPEFNREGNLTGMHGADMAILPSDDGGTVRDLRTGPNLGDAEGLVQQCDGTLLVSFERKHRVWRYGLGKPVNMPVPEAVQGLDYNSGLESLGYFPEDGALLLIAEDAPGATHQVPAWIGRGEQWQALEYVPHGTLMPTDVAVAPGGDIYILERGYGLRIYPQFTIRIRHTTRAEVERTGRIEGEELFFSDADWLDNMEGLTVQDRPGRRDLYVISDNNYSRARRTLLLQFRLPMPDAAPEAPFTGCGNGGALLQNTAPEQEKE